MKHRGLAAAAVLAAATACSIFASAQPKRPARPGGSSSAFPTATGPTNLRAHVGADYASRLAQSPDPDERIRGIQRAAAIGTPEAIAALVESVERTPQRKADPRASIESARALARFADQERARAGLLLLVNAPSPDNAGRPALRTSDGATIDDGDPGARTELAREIAAIALARSGVDRAFESLYAAARSGGSGQAAAIHALTLYPPREPGSFGSSGISLPVPVIRLLGQLGDLRVLDLLHAATRSTDVSVRSAALVSLAELGDERAIGLARTAIVESDARLRAAAGEAFVLLSAPERIAATTALVSDEATIAIGVHLADNVHDPAITKLLVARGLPHPDRELRLAAIRALGRTPEDAAAKALAAPALLGDRDLSYYALLALARSPAPGAGQLIANQAATATRIDLKTMAIRAYVVRALGRKERASAADKTIASLLRSRGPERALAVFARVALGDDSVDDYLADADARVRRAAAMGALTRPPKDSAKALLARLEKEPDPTTRQVLGAGLLAGDEAATITTSALVDRAESGGGDAALAAYALARRADETTARRVGQLLASRDPVLRAHTARGLAAASLPDTSGRLAEAYAYETDVDVRRAILAALAARTQDASSPSRRRTLELAAELDPDGPSRQTARRALDGATRPFAPAPITEVAWIKIAQSAGETPKGPFAGSVVRSDGLAVPIAFDDDGYALVPGLPPGEARLVLAPRLPAYETPAP